MTLRLLLLLDLALLAACGADTSHITALSDDRYDVRDNGDCVRDTVTGLVWERKEDEPGLRNWRSTYTWFDPNEAHHELDYRGTENGGACEDSVCDTWHYVEAVNAVGLCGHDDWRLPVRDELLSISDLSRAATPPTANPFAFPFMQAAEYWSANDYSFQPDSAWAWNFLYGHDRVDWKKSPKYLRLVRGQAADLAAVRE